MDATAAHVHIAPMTGPTLSLLAAVLSFVLGHFLLSSIPVRQVLIARIGESGFRGLYSVAVVAALVWIVFAYGAARYDAQMIWFPPPVFAMIPVLVMPLSCILLVCSVTTKTVTAVGGEALISDSPTPRGITTVTRHPMLVGTTLWGLAHLCANGDSASVILFLGMIILSIGGMMHIDHRRQKTLGSDWGPIALTTSLTPFLAALQGRAKVDWAGIGLWRIAAGLGLYAALLYGHPWFAGVPILPH